MTKESLIEKFWKDCKDKKLEPMSECEQIDMMWDFFWNEMQKEREGLEKKIIGLKRGKIKIPVGCPENRIGCLVAHFKEIEPEDDKVIDRVLALIKQSNDNRE